MRWPRRVVERVIAVCALGLPLRDARASSNAGIEFVLGSFELHVYYSDAVEYPGGLDAEIRDPRFALFTLAAFLQANAASLESIHHTIVAELYARRGSRRVFLSVIEDPQKTGVVLRDGPVVRGVATTILGAICPKHPDACKRPPSSKVRLYPCESDRCAGAIRFGAFPSDSVQRSFALLRPATAGRHTSFLVTRREVTRYFTVLEP